MAKVTKEKFKTEHSVFDEFTNLTLFKLISQGHFEGLQSPISVGKEGNIFSALTKGEKKVIVKIYRLETCDFKRMYNYIRDDPRFANLNNKRRDVIFTWCQREYRNLLRAREANISAPLPIAFLNNVLVIEFIGNGDVAPKLKDLIPNNRKKFFEMITDDIRKLYKAGFVHADLSQFNILNHKEVPVIIDWSHCTPLRNPNSKELLERDIRNICNFFKKIGLKVSEEKVLGKIIKNQ